MAPYQRIIKLKECVLNRQVLSQHKGKFLPDNKLSELVTRDEVSSAFQDATIWDAEGLVDFVLNDAKRLFLILVMMTSKGDEKLSLLRGLQRDGINDASLPIDFKPENEQFSGYSLEGPSDGPQFAVFNKWEPMDRDSFDLYQWRFTAPVFDVTDQSRFRFRFASNRILPYLKVAQKPTSSGFFGEVSRIEIHPAHIRGLTAASNLPPLCSLWFH